MKITNINKELSGLNTEGVQLKVEEWRRQLLSLRLSAATSHIKDSSQFKKLRKNIARGMTLLSSNGVVLNKKKELINE